MKYLKQNLFFILILCIVFTPKSVKCQTSKDSINSLFTKTLDTKAKSHQLLFNISPYRITNGFVTPVTKVFFPVFSLRWGYNPANRWTVGMEYQHQAIWGTGVSKTIHNSWIGPFGRYYVWRKKNAAYIELDYRISNTAFSQGFIFRKFPSNYVGIGYGISAKIRPNWYVNYGQNFHFNIDKGSFGYLRDQRLSLAYHFNKQEKDTPFYISDEKRDRTGQFLYSLSAGYLPFDSLDFDGGYDWIDVINRGGYYFSPYLSAGIYNRFTIGNSHLPNVKTQHFVFVGPFINFKLFALKRFNFFVELAYLATNFTYKTNFSSNELPQYGYSEYLNSTTGFSYRINNQLSIELAQSSSEVIRSTGDDDLNSVGGYRIGIEYCFKKKTIASKK